MWVKSNVKNNVSGKLKIKSVIPEFVSSAGFQFFLHEKFQISLGMFYNRLLTDISGYSSPDAFRLSTQPGHVKSMMEGSNKVSASSMGIKVSFRYLLHFREFPH